jgi:hypothetical protein
MPDEKKQKYKIGGADFRFKKQTYPEGSELELTAVEFKELKTRIKLIPVKEVKNGKNK